MQKDEVIAVEEKPTEAGELSRSLSFADVFFLSFGGMSPLLSLITYGAVALALGALLSPLIMLIGTSLVLLNGLVVVQLSKRFRTSGGYYTYAFLVLTERVGLSTGWMYLFYSLLFGFAYVIGAVFVVTAVFNVSPFVILFAILIPAASFLVLGVRPSAKYAAYSGIAEIALIAAIVGISFVLTAGKTYIPNPVTYHISTGDMALAILFAMGIPTGYGAIAPISGEVKNPERTVGKAAVSVILAGGVLASIFLYAVSNLLYQSGVAISSISSPLPIVAVLSHNFSAYGRYLVFAVVAAAISDGVLAILSFGLAASRTIFKMGVDRSFPSGFSRKIRNQPIVANLTVAILMLVVPVVIIGHFPPEFAFIILGTIASLAGLFIHITTGFSLLRVGIRRGRRKVLRGAKSTLNKLRDYNEAVLAGIAAVVTSIELIYSAYSTLPAYTVIFLVWIVFGYVIVDIKDVVSRTPLAARPGRGERLLAERIRDLTSLKVRAALPDVIVDRDASVKEAVDRCLELDAQGAVVIDSYRRPIGIFLLRDVFLLSEEDVRAMRVRDMWLDPAITIKGNADVSSMIKIFKETGEPILAIVDDSGMVGGTVREREVLMALGSQSTAVTVSGAAGDDI